MYPPICKQRALYQVQCLQMWHGAVSCLSSHPGLAHGPGYLAYNGVFSNFPAQIMSSCCLHTVFALQLLLQERCLQLLCLDGHGMLFAEHLHGPIPHSLLERSCRCCFCDSPEPSGLPLVQWGTLFCLRSYFQCISLIKGRTHFFYVKG